MLSPLLDIKIGHWSIQVFESGAIAKYPPGKLPKSPAIYVLNLNFANYVGQSIDAYRRVQYHIRRMCKQNGGPRTATLILNQAQPIDEALLIHIEFGLMLIHLGCDRRLVSKQTDLPFGSKTVRQRALEFFEEFAARFFHTAPHLIGSRSRKNRQAIDQALPYLRMIWTDR